MDPQTVIRLLDLNRQFYSEFAESFSATRSTAWPGFARLLPHVSDGARILDIGCGNGRMARYLDEHAVSGRYLGLDFSERMLSEARRASAHQTHLTVDFRCADIASPDWVSALPAGAYDVVLVLAVLQHIPSSQLRVSIVSRIASLLARQGVLLMSHWQFMDSERLRGRIVPWSRVGIAEDDLEPGDYLLEWRRDGSSYRYCHLVSAAEVQALAHYSALEVVEIFRADGREADLNLYALLALPGASMSSLPSTGQPSA